MTPSAAHGQADAEAKSAANPAEPRPEPPRGPQGLEIGRGWNRVFARLFDMSLVFGFFAAGLQAGLALALGHESMFDFRDTLTQTHFILMTCAFMVVWGVVESAMVTAFGTTPGKRLLGLAVVDAEGRKPTVGAAFKRTYGALTMGYALGVPVVSLCTNLYWFVQIMEPFRTPTWDRMATTTVVVTRQVPTWARGFIVLLTIVAALMALGI